MPLILIKKKIIFIILQVNIIFPRDGKCPILSIVPKLEPMTVDNLRATEQ